MGKNTCQNDEVEGGVYDCAGGDEKGIGMVRMEGIVVGKTDDQEGNWAAGCSAWSICLCTQAGPHRALHGITLCSGLVACAL